MTLMTRQRDVKGRFTAPINFPRDNDNRLPSYGWPGAYPVYYLTKSGLVVCPPCANEPDTSDPVAAGDINWEDASLFCEDCGERIESAYAEPE
jgi:hypothetical protein